MSDVLNVKQFVSDYQGQQDPNQGQQQQQPAAPGAPVAPEIAAHGPNPTATSAPKSGFTVDSAETTGAVLGKAASLAKTLA